MYLHHFQACDLPVVENIFLDLVLHILLKLFERTLRMHDVNATFAAVSISSKTPRNKTMHGQRKVLKGWRKRWELQKWERLLHRLEMLRWQLLLERLDELREKLEDEAEDDL